MKDNKKFKKIIRLIGSFILLNVIVVLMVMAKQTIGRPYPIAKMNMSVAVTIHFLYEKPLTMLFGPYNILTKPVYKARDYFYNQGMKHLPMNDAERYIWWSRIKFDEWYIAVQDEMLNYIGKKIDLNKSELDKQLKWTDEIYNNLIPMAQLPLKDKVFKSVRFKTYNDVAWFYVTTRGSLIHRMYYPINNEDFPYNSPVILNNDEINKDETILNNDLLLKQYAGKYEKQGINNFFNSKNWYGDSMLKENLYMHILANKIINNKINCNSEYVQDYFETINELTNKVPKDGRISDYEKFRIKKDLNSKLNKFVLNNLNQMCTIK